MGVRQGEEGAKAENVVEMLHRELLGEVLPRLEGCPNEARRYLEFLAWLNARLEALGLGRIIVTGGFAVEVYTGRVYRTMDVDIIVDGLEAHRVVERLLERVSERVGRGFLPKTRVLEAKSIDIVSSCYPEGRAIVKLVVELGHVYLEPPEELIVRYLAGWKFWGSTEDRDKALWVYVAWMDRLDYGYLRRRAREENVEDKLGELEELVEQARQQIEDVSAGQGYREEAAWGT